VGKPFSRVLITNTASWAQAGTAAASAQAAIIVIAQPFTEGFKSLIVASCKVGRRRAPGSGRMHSACPGRKKHKRICAAPAGAYPQRDTPPAGRLPRR
jgi:hypothetical protein